MISEKRIREKIRQYILDATLSDNDQIQDSTLLFEEGFFDSMGLLFLIDFLRNEFNVDTKDEEIITENFESINCIVQFVSKRMISDSIKESVIDQH